MPLRDHFRPPISNHSSWEGFHGMWPGEMVRALLPYLPRGYIAEPRVHLRNLYELDINAYETEFLPAKDWAGDEVPLGSVAIAAPQLKKPILTLNSDLTDEYEYEVLVFDRTKNRRLVAAVEIVSPGNKDRPKSRRSFVSKCAALLQERVNVSIVDLVTSRNFNLYADLLKLIDLKDPLYTGKPPSTYAVSIRGRQLRSDDMEGQSVLDLWPHTLKIGQPLPTLPIWLDEDVMIPLDLEACYEETCRILRVSANA